MDMHKRVDNVSEPVARQSLAEQGIIKRENKIVSNRNKYGSICCCHCSIFSTDSTDCLKEYRQNY